MNKANITKAITIMERVRDSGKALNMDYWQQTDVGDTIEVEADCGTACCLGGWIAISPEFKADGGCVSIGGAPERQGQAGTAAIQSWLGLDFDQARALCGTQHREMAYPKATDAQNMALITFDEVIDNLVSLANDGVLLYEDDAIEY